MVIDSRQGASMKYILQVFTGFRDTTVFGTEQIIERIGLLASRMEVRAVIIGWAADPASYRKIGDFLHEKGIRMLLWLPVFSEVSGSLHPDPARDVFGKTVAAPVLPEEGETFHFVCPSSEHNADIVKSTYEAVYSGGGFDGVFLDRIRSQTFVAGVSGVFSCACEKCSRAFLQRGVDIGEVRKLYEERKERFFDIASWPANGEFVLINETARRYFEAREEIIAGAVTNIIRHFKEKGLIVGLDLFAPFVSRIAGQNYRLMTAQADFIKPMLYRRTEAPAGIGYEYTLFQKYAPEAWRLSRLTLDRAFLHAQLQAMESLPCEKYPGIEINYDPELVRTDPDYIRESLNAVREHGFDGATLCWNVMQAPDAHLDAAVYADIRP